MTKLLHIVGSPRQADSRSFALATLMIDAWCLREPGLEVETMDLWREPLPEFDGDKAAAKMKVITGSLHDQRTQSAWDVITHIASRFTQADAYMFSVPMWNGGIPYRLKLYIDLLMQPGILFGFDAERGYEGLLKNKRAAAIYTSGVYQPGLPPAFGQDFHSSYMEWWLRAIGIEQIETVRYQPTLLAPDPAKVFNTAVQDAQSAAARLAQSNPTLTGR
jgi:FMN-dependent NADH-azoreductase